MKRLRVFLARLRVAWWLSVERQAHARCTAAYDRLVDREAA